MRATYMVHYADYPSDVRSRRVQDVELPVRSPVPLDVSPKVKTHSLKLNLDFVLRQAEVVSHNLELFAGLLVGLWQRMASICGAHDMRLEGEGQHGMNSESGKVDQDLQGRHQPSRFFGVLQKRRRPLEVMGRGLLAALETVQI